MAKIPARALHTGGGVNYDQQPNSLPKIAFSDIVNGRFTKTRLERIGGSILYQNVASDSELTESRALFNFTRGGVEGLLLITNNKMYIDDGGGWQDYTSATAMVDATDWTFDQYGDVIIVTSLLNVPYVLMPAGTTFVVFTNWPPTYKAGRIFAYKNFLIAVNVEISSDKQNGFVAWSDVVIDGGADIVEWAPLPTNLAGTNILPDGTGPIIEGGVLRDSAILYADRSAWRMDMASISAGTDLVFNFRRIFADDGIYAPRCWVEVQGIHLVIGLNHIYTHDGFNRQLIADNRVNEFFYGNIGTARFTFVANYNRTQEIIISYATQNFAEANEALVWNYVYNTWTRWVFSETAGVYSHFVLGPLFSAAIVSWNDLITSGESWTDLMLTSWNSMFPDATARIPYILSNILDKITLIDNPLDDGSIPVVLTIERVDLDFDEEFGDDDNIKHIRRLLPLVSGTGQFTFQAGGRNALNQPVMWLPLQTYDLLNDYKLDFRISYRYPAIRFIQTFDDGFMSLTGYDVDVTSLSGH